MQELLRQFVVAVAATSIATLMRIALTPWLGDAAPLVFYTLAVLVAALIGGFTGGLLATILSTTISWFVFLPPFRPNSAIVRASAFLLNGIVISLIGHRIRVERRRADVTGRELRGALKQSGEAQQALAMQARVLESMAEGVCVVTERGVLLFTNPAFDAMFGSARGALLGTNIADLKDAPSEEAYRRYAAAVAESRQNGSWEGEQRHRRSDGTTFLTQTRITPMPAGGDWYFVCVQDDVTERRRAEEALQSLNQDLRDRVQEMSTLLDVLPIGIGIAVDSTGEQIRANRALAHSLRLSPEANASLSAAHAERPKSFRVLQDGAELPPEELPLQRAARRGEATRDVELDVVFDDGSSIRLLEYAVPLFDSDGNPRGSIGAFVDISERRAAEKERESLVAALTKHGRELSVLSSAAQEVNKVLDAAAIVRTLIRAALEISDASSGVVVLSFPNAPTRPICQMAGEADQSPCEACEVGAAEWVFKHRAPYLANAVADDSEITAPARNRFQLQNLVCLPIIGREETLLGCLELHNKPGGFTAGDIVKLQALSAGASIALENARLLTQIREADRRKDDFLAMLAHELRNPLAPLRSAVDVLMMLDDDDDSIGQLREVMDRQITHMGRIIDDLLDVSRLTRGRVELRREAVDLTKLVGDAVTAHRGIFESGSHTIELRLPSSPVWVDGDATRLSQILDNLLSNARKFTDAGGTIRVTLEQAEARNQAELEVSDTGIGVSPEDIGRIFEIFTQADRSLDRRRGGLGLGLALVKGLIDLHGGSVEARSEGLGHGCAIRVTLPLSAAPATCVEDREVLISTKAALRILVIEDNCDAADTLRLLLEAHGYQVAVADDGRSGVKAAKNDAPDVVICDIGLPEMDGFEVARALRNDPTTADVRLVALTGYGRDADIRRAHDAGFDDHLTKPADARRLLEILVAVSLAAGRSSNTVAEG